MMYFVLGRLILVQKNGQRGMTQNREGSNRNHLCIYGKRTSGGDTEYVRTTLRILGVYQTSLSPSLGFQQNLTVICALVEAG